jgi:hypothetical protein
VIAHVAGIPAEELLVQLMLGTGALGVGVRAVVARRRSERELVERRPQ